MEILGLFMEATDDSVVICILDRGVCVDRHKVFVVGSTTFSFMLYQKDSTTFFLKKIIPFSLPVCFKQAVYLLLDHPAKLTAGKMTIFFLIGYMS